MREIFSILDLRTSSIENEIVFEYYAQTLVEHEVSTFTLFILQTTSKEIKITELYRIQEIFRNRDIVFNYYICDLFDASASFYKTAYNRRITTCNGSRYVFVDLPYTSSFSEQLYDYLMSIIHMNYKPVLINVEKHPYLFNYEDLLKELIDLGCYIAITYDGEDNSDQENSHEVLANIHSKGLCHMMFSDFLINPAYELDFRFWLAYYSTQYVANIVFSDNIHCMLADRELAGISGIVNILKHPTIDSKLAEARWKR